MESILDSTYAHGEKLDAVLSPYDGITQGVINAIEAKRPDMKPGTDTWPYITGQDAMEIAVSNIAKDKQGETVFKNVNELADAVYEMTGAKDNYDYLEKFMPDTPTASLMSGGGCSYEYANRDGGSTQILVTEMPYYVDERVSDTSLTSRSRRQVILESCAVAQEYFSIWKPVSSSCSWLTT